jgi:Ni,Fe-hydrogenase I large subunit
MEALSMAKVLIDPITRIEGHLSIELDVQNGRVVDAKCKGDMYRGFEKILEGRNPVDANQITQRICGVCPISHGLASSRCLDDAFGITPNKNGRILRNLILIANYLQSHILHFYHLAALDFVDIKALLGYSGRDEKLNNLKEWAKDELNRKKDRVDALSAVAPFLPRYEGDTFYIKNNDLNIEAIRGYVNALDIRMKAHKMVALFGGRAPHAIGLVPGGVTQIPTRSKIREYRKLLKEVEAFVSDSFAPHVIAVAKEYPDYFKLGRYSNFLSFGLVDTDGEQKNYMFQRGAFYDNKIAPLDTSLIREQVKYARYRSGTNLHPLEGQTDADTGKAGAYTWLKAPRYNAQPMEVGPLARVAIAYIGGNQEVKKELDAILAVFNAEVPSAFSVLGRYASRVIECKLLARKAHELLDELDANGAPRSTYEIPESGEGEGLAEAPRGALGHWISIKNHVIEKYPAVGPTTWYCGPKDDSGVRGPDEQALIGTPISDNNNPIEAARVVRSFDPCIACAVHVMEGDREISRSRVC